MIPVCDLQRQYASLKTEIDAAMQATAAEAKFILGPNVKALEKEIADYCDCKFAAGVGNGTDALHLALRALRIGPGDEVIIPAPYWVSYSALVELAGAIPVIVPTTEASGFCMTADQFRKAITPRTRLLMLNNPSNPTGATYPVEQLQSLAQVAIEKQIPVLSDEIYEKLLYKGSEFRCFASFSPEVAARTIIVSGVSKAYAMTGWRIGWTIGPVDVIRAMDNLQSQETSNPCSVSQHAAVEGLMGPQESVEAMRLEFEKRRSYVMDRMRPWRNRFQITFIEPGGAFYVFFNIAAAFGRPLAGGCVVQNATEFCTALLEQTHVALVTGDAFGAPGYVRLSFATDMETIRDGLDRIESFLSA